MFKARRRARSSDLEAYWERHREKRKHFEKENRSKRRTFDKRNEHLLRCCSDNTLTDAMPKDKKRRYSLKRMTSKNGELLVPSAFTEFMIN